jgi:hypothetical protein
MSQEPDAAPQPPDVAIIPEPSQRSWLTEGILIALIPASAYLWALYYEVGFCEYFHIPYGLISLNPTTVLASSLPAFFILSLPVILLLFVVFFVAYEQISMLVFFVLVGMGGMWTVLFSGESYQKRILVAVLTLMMLGIVFIPPFRRPRAEGNYWRRLWVSLLRTTSPTAVTRSRPQLRVRRIDFLLILVILAVIWAFIPLSRGLGKGGAKGLRDFLIVAAESPRPEVAVVRVYGDYLFTVPFDRTTKEFEKKLYLLKISEMAEVPLVLENIGPLSPKP